MLTRRVFSLKFQKMQPWLNKYLVALWVMSVMTPSIYGQKQGTDYLLIKSRISGKNQSITDSFRPFPTDIPIPLGAAMWVYQNLISPHLSATCLYHPSCSSYSVDLLRRFGTIPGIVMSADRLTRCNRLVINDIPFRRVNPLSGKVEESTDFYVWSDHPGK